MYIYTYITLKKQPIHRENTRSVITFLKIIF